MQDTKISRFLGQKFGVVPWISIYTALVAFHIEFRALYNIVRNAARGLHEIPLTSVEWKQSQWGVPFVVFEVHPVLYGLKATGQKKSFWLVTPVTF